MEAEVFCLLNACGAEGTRTPDPHTASVVRYQLRHSPVFVNARPVKSVPSAKAKLHHARIRNQIRSSPVELDTHCSVAVALPIRAAYVAPQLSDE